MTATSFTLTVEGRPQIPELAELWAPVRPAISRVHLTGVNHLNTVVPVDRGLMRSSMQPGVGVTRVVPGADGLPAAAEWGTNSPGAVTNEGVRRGPGKPSRVKNIQRWVTRKGLQPRPLPPTKSGRARKPQSREAQVRSMAFAIAKSHAKKGQATGPTYVSGPLAGKSTAGWFDTLAPVVDRALDAEVARVGDAIAAEWARGG